MKLYGDVDIVTNTTWSEYREVFEYLTFFESSQITSGGDSCHIGTSKLI